MNTKELRIGNFIKGLSIEKVEWLGDQVVNLYRVGCYSPVELTEDWLTKFGFEKYSGGYLSKDSVIELTFDFLVWKPNIERLKILYVHQLQNLYFAITGKELEVI